MTGSNSPAPVLILAGSHEATCQCIRSLGRRGVGVLAAADAPTPGLASKYCDEVYAAPSANEDFRAYRDAILHIVEDRPVSTVIPCREEDAYLLSKYRSRFEDHVALVTPSFDRLRTVHDRVRLFEAAANAGVPIPETRRLGEVTDWSDRLIVKSRYNLLTSDYLDDCPVDAPRTVSTVVHPTPGEPPDVAAIRARMGHEPIVQEFVGRGDEYMVGALCDDGEVLATYQHRQIRGDSYVGGGGVYRESVFDPDLEAVARRLLTHLQWTGLACIEYVRDPETGAFKFVEINPRMWQSLPSTVVAGADFPVYYWQQATGRGGRIDPGYDVGVGCHRLSGELGYLFSLFRDDSPHVTRPSVARTLWAIGTSCLSQPHFDYLSLDDPRPFLCGLRQFLDRR